MLRIKINLKKCFFILFLKFFSGTNLVHFLPKGPNHCHSTGYLKIDATHLYDKHKAIIWNIFCKKKCILLGCRHQINVFLNCYWISFQDRQSFFEFLVSVINYFYINGLNLFWNSFEWFLSSNKLWREIFFLSCPRHCDQGLIVVIVYNFQIWNKKEHNIIISRIMSGHMGPMYILPSRLGL